MIGWIFNALYRYHHTAERSFDTDMHTEMLWDSLQQSGKIDDLVIEKAKARGLTSLPSFAITNADGSPISDPEIVAEVKRVNGEMQQKYQNALKHS